MPVLFDSDKKLFTIHTANSTYQFKAGPYGFLLHLYYGKRVENQDMGYLIRSRDRGFSGNPYDSGGDRSFSLDTLPLEFPASGTGDYRITAAGVINPDGSRTLDPRYKTHTVTKGKYSLPGLQPWRRQNKTDKGNVA